MDDRPLDLCRQARDAFERVAEAKGPPHEDIARAARLVIALRDELIASLRRGGGSGGERDMLGSVNAILSLATAAQYPISGRQPERLEQTFKALDELCASYRA